MPRWCYCECAGRSSMALVWPMASLVPRRRVRSRRSRRWCLQLPLHHHNRVQDEPIGFPDRQKRRGANRGRVLDTIWALLQLRVSFPVKAPVCPQCASPLIRAGVMTEAWQLRVRSLRAQHRTFQEGCPGKHPSLLR